MTNNGIYTYLEAQKAKGLLYNLRWGPRNLTYETHSKTHEQVLLPEVERLAKELGRHFHWRISPLEDTCDGVMVWFMLSEGGFTV